MVVPFPPKFLKKRLTPAVSMLQFKVTRTLGWPTSSILKLVLISKLLRLFIFLFLKCWGKQWDSSKSLEVLQNFSGKSVVIFFWSKFVFNKIMWIVLIYFYTHSSPLNSEWIYEVIASPKMPTKNMKDFCPTYYLINF